MPLSPDTLVLPAAVDELPARVVEAAMRVLGQAWSIANAPSGTLPARRDAHEPQVVTQKALALAEAGLRVSLGQRRSTRCATLGVRLLGRARRATRASTSSCATPKPAGRCARSSEALRPRKSR